MKKMPNSSTTVSKISSKQSSSAINLIIRKPIQATPVIAAPPAPIIKRNYILLNHLTSLAKSFMDRLRRTKKEDTLTISSPTNFRHESSVGLNQYNEFEVIQKMNPISDLSDAQHSSRMASSFRTSWCQT